MSAGWASPTASAAKNAISVRCADCVAPDYLGAPGDIGCCLCPNLVLGSAAHAKNVVLILARLKISFKYVIDAVGDAF